jgi:hypothetical protein
MFVESRLRYAEWESSPDGRRQHRAEIVAARVKFLGTPSGKNPLGSETEVEINDRVDSVSR